MSKADPVTYRITVTKRDYEVVSESFCEKPQEGLSSAQSLYGDDYLFIVEPYEGEVPTQVDWGYWDASMVP